jgi:hypothetical protein
MTRKDYVLIATRLIELRQDLKEFCEGCEGSEPFDRFMSRLCADLKQDNPNFDSAKFREKVYHG